VKGTIGGGSRLNVRVIPNARKTAFAGYRENELLLRLNAPALDGRANQAARDFMAAFFAVPKSAITLLAGEKSRHKIFEIIGLESIDIERKLAAGQPLTTSENGKA
jgi:uncharacterized protein (TIGR00251 family)